MTDLVWSENEIQLKDLKEYDKNPRRISKESFNRLVRSLQEHGYNNRMLVDLDNTIIGGHQRIRALKEIGYKNTDFIKVLMPNRKLTEDEFKRLNVRDNGSFGEFDLDLLSFDFEIPELIELGVPEFLFKDLDAEEKVEEVEGQDDVPELDPVHVVSKIGDLWTLGNHRVLCGDSTNVTEVERLMDGNKVDMVFTDPPYNTGMSKKTNGDSTWLNHMFDDSFTDQEWQDLMSAFCSNYYLIMKDDSVAYICLDWRRNHELVPHIKNNFKLSNIIVWDKVVHGLGSDYKYTYELINVCKKGSPAINSHQGDDRQYSDVWHIQRKMGRDDEHATKKPLELVERSLFHASKKYDKVADLFGGSGSTLIACEKTDRQCYMMELDPCYVDVIINRWQKLTGRQAVLEETNQSYDELKAQVEGA